MGEYIKHREYSNDNEIKIAVCRGRNVTEWEPIYPIEILKELSYLGYEDWYAGSFENTKENTSFLDKLIVKYDGTNKKWANNKDFSELVAKSTSDEIFIEELISNGEFDIIILRNNGVKNYLISNYYINDFKKLTDKNGLKVEIKNYEYQHSNKINTYEFSEIIDN